MSVGDILREAIGVQANSVQVAYDRGLNKGRSDTEQLYRVDYRCSVCGGTITLATSEEKQAVREYMRENGWAHGSCRD
jgi:hypothetical protein